MEPEHVQDLPFLPAYPRYSATATVLDDTERWTAELRFERPPLGDRSAVVAWDRQGEDEPLSCQQLAAAAPPRQTLGATLAAAQEQGIEGKLTHYRVMAIPDSDRDRPASLGWTEYHLEYRPAWVEARGAGVGAVPYTPYVAASLPATGTWSVAFVNERAFPTP